MIQWNELRITPDSKHLIIDVSIEDLPYYNNINIAEIKIDTQDTYIDMNCPSDKAVYTYTVDNLHNTDYPYPKDKIKHLRLCLGNDRPLEELLDIDFSKNLLFVYVRVEGSPSTATPCGMDKEIEMQSVVNLLPIYDMAMSYIKSLQKECTDTSVFAYEILKYKAFELSIRTGNYPLAIKYFNKFYRSTICKPIKCNCNGLY